jgi:hypothetical protein
MSTPEEIRSQENESAASQSPTVAEPLNMEAAVQQLRILIAGLGAGLLMLSLALSAYVYKQNRNLSGAINGRERQIEQLQVNQKPLIFALNELGNYSAGKPELLAIFTRHGIQFAAASGASTPAPAPTAP